MIHANGNQTLVHKAYALLHAVCSLMTMLPAVRRHAQREAERQKVQEHLLELERRREELKGLLAVYSNE